MSLSMAERFVREMDQRKPELSMPSARSDNDDHGITAEGVAAYECQVPCCRCNKPYDEELDECPHCGKRGCS